MYLYVKCIHYKHTIQWYTSFIFIKGKEKYAVLSYPWRSRWIDRYIYDMYIAGESTDSTARNVINLI